MLNDEAVSQLNLPLPGFKPDEAPETRTNRNSGRGSNRLDPQDRPFHDWYRFVLSFPPHLVRDYVEHFGLDERHVILDPFCGTGTTLVEAQLRGVPGAGIEANPFARFASSVKLNWGIDPDAFAAGARKIAEAARSTLRSQGIDDDLPVNADLGDLHLRALPPESAKLLLKNSISPLPLHKALILLECINFHRTQPYFEHAILALAKTLVFSISNLHFGPEVGVGKLRTDVPVVSTWLSEVRKISRDLSLVSGKTFPVSTVHLGDARQVTTIIEPESIDAIITSPPYPNEKDYTRTTRLESVILGFVSDMPELRSFKKTFVRSNTRGVYKGDDDHKWIAGYSKIQEISASIERRRKELGKTSGFEKQYAKVVGLYFGGMARHLAELRQVLRPGAKLAYVVGDQASYLRVMIRTGQLLAEIAEDLGYELKGIDLFRERLATATKQRLREEVVVLQWPG